MFEYRYIDNELWCEDLKLENLAKEFGTPLYVYSKNSIIDHCRTFENVLKNIDHLSCYSIKANSNLNILRVIAEEGLGADAGSIGELYLALKAGFPPDKITFSGVGKRDDEISYALKNSISLFIVESESELLKLDNIANNSGIRANIQIRVNFNLPASTHPYISTGEHHNKFGISLDKLEQVLERALSLPNINFLGIHTHIGSQITDPSTFETLADSILKLINNLREKNIPVQHLNFGGGFGVQYHDFVKHPLLPYDTEYSDSNLTTIKLIEKVLPRLKKGNAKVYIQPGRSIIAHAGVLLTKILYIKQNKEKKFIITDAGMNDLIRPSLYRSYHQISPLKIKSNIIETVDIVGPLCESGDFFAIDRELNRVEEGDYLCIFCTGAYGFVLASNYNGRLKPAEILINNNQVMLIRERENLSILG